MRDPFRVVTGEIEHLICNSCGVSIYHFVFEGDTDQNTLGLTSVSRPNKHEVVISETRPQEWNSFESGGSDQLVKRLAREFCVSDLFVLRILRNEKTSKRSEESKSFQEFLHSYRAPVLVYACPCCVEGELKMATKSSIKEFLKNGGRLTINGNLDVY